MPELVSIPEQRAILDDVRRNYVLPAGSAIPQFLADRPYISELLLHAVPQLKQCFGADCVVSLRAPMDEAGDVTLYAVIMWTGGVRHVRQALARFDEAWWLARSTEALGYLEFTYELA